MVMKQKPKAGSVGIHCHAPAKAAKKTAVKPAVSKPAAQKKVKAAPVQAETAQTPPVQTQTPTKMTTASLKIKFGDALREEIKTRSIEAFKRFDAKNPEHVTRCHRVEKNRLVYRLPDGARTVPGQGVVVTRTGKGDAAKVTITREIVDGLRPVDGWPASYGIK